jgi:hypothetical protein
MNTSGNKHTYNKNSHNKHTKGIYRQQNNDAKEKNTNTIITSNYNDVITNLQSYMFNNIQSHIKYEFKPPPTKNKNVIVKSRPSTLNNFFSPKQKDSLFWCFYIICNGFTLYEIESTNFVKEKNEKVKYVELLRQNKNILKEHKIKPLTEIEDNLANQTQINIKTFVALCILEKINIMIINHHTYFEIKNNDSANIFIMHQNDLFRFSIELNATPDKIQTYRDTYFQRHQIDKPLLSISSYKIDELKSFCTKLQITEESIQKKLKQDIFDLIITTLNKIDSH